MILVLVPDVDISQGEKLVKMFVSNSVHILIIINKRHNQSGPNRAPSTP